MMKRTPTQNVPCIVTSILYPPAHTLNKVKCVNMKNIFFIYISLLFPLF